MPFQNSISGSPVCPLNQLVRTVFNSSAFLRMSSVSLVRSFSSKYSPNYFLMTFITKSFL